MIPIKEAAKKLGISRNALYMHVRRGNIRAYYIWGKIYIREKDLNEESLIRTYFPPFYNSEEKKEKE